MALDIKLSILNSSDNTFINIKDITGTYNATTNPTGYGTPNGSAPTSIYLVIKSWDSIEISKQLLSGSIVTDILGGSGHVFTSAQLGMGDRFNSKVFLIDYYPFVKGTTGTVTFTKDSKVVTTTGDFTSLIDSATGAISLSNAGAPYIINRSTILPGSLSLVDTYTGNTTTVSTFYQAYKVQSKFLAIYLVEDCISKAIFELFTISERTTKKEMEANRLVTYLDAAQIHYDRANYQRTTDLLTYITNYCKTGSC